MKRLLSLIGSLVSLGCLTACGSTGVSDKPAAAVASSSRQVALKVLDNRPPHEGGLEPSIVGFRRSAVGIKSSIKESGPDVVTNLARTATEDALSRVGIGVGADAPATLHAQVLAFWMDWSGYDLLSGVSYKGTVIVEYTLKDATGRTLWKGLAMTEQHARHADKRRIFGRALDRLAGRAARRFGTSEFQKAVPQMRAGL